MSWLCGVQSKSEESGDDPIQASTSSAHGLQFSGEITPYFAGDYEVKITTAPKPDVRTNSVKQTEAGLSFSQQIPFLNDNTSNYTLNAPCSVGPIQSVPYITHCGSIFSERPYYIDNQIDHSHIVVTSLRYIPFFNAASTLCINYYCGTPFSIWRFGLLADARLNIGRFTDRGPPADATVNQDYVRLGGRAGAILQLNLLHEFPIDLSGSYTAFNPIYGFNHDLGEFQGDAALNFGPGQAFSLSVTYRNGRREDTAARDETWGIKLGAKN